LISPGEGGAPERIRTSDTRFRKPMLYPLSYEGVLGETVYGVDEAVIG
jgi:hypothetical protein